MLALLAGTFLVAYLWWRHARRYGRLGGFSLMFGPLFCFVPTTFLIVRRFAGAVVAPVRKHSVKAEL
jgi:hypothetical protein